MLLQRLKEYSDRLALPPPLYNLAPVRYVLELASDGRFLSLIDTAEASSRATRRGQPKFTPQIQRSSGIKPLLLSDKADYALGYADDGDKPDRVAACHKSFVELVAKCAQETHEPSVEAALHFLEAGPLAQMVFPQDFDPSATITFRVNGLFLIDLASVRAFWATHNDPSLAGAPIMQCVVCGQQRPVLNRLQAKIKGVPGGQTSGTSIISANADAFESYGLEASLIAPTCADCAERFTKAANDLLAAPTSALRLNSMAFLFWTKEKVDFNPLDFFDQPDPQQVQGLINAVRNGHWNPDVDDTAFYATALSGSGGRAVVRDWLDTTVREVKENLAKWFVGQTIVDINGQREPGTYLGHRALAFATVREAKDLPVTTPRILLRCALTGAPLPMDILYQAVRRIRAERAVTRSKAALIKLVLMTQPDTDYKEDFMVALEMDHPSSAYHCGRLLAVLEEAQREAIENLNTTVGDRYFGAASSTPLYVFPRLLEVAKHHLSKLQRDDFGAYYGINERLQEVLSHIPGRENFPRTLGMEEQGLFTLGYYHQRAADVAKMEAAKARKSASPKSSHPL